MLFQGNSAPELVAQASRIADALEVLARSAKKVAPSIAAIAGAHEDLLEVAKAFSSKRGRELELEVKGENSAGERDVEETSGDEASANGDDQENAEPLRKRQKTEQ